VTPKRAARQPAVAGPGAQKKGKGRIDTGYDAWRLPSGKRMAEFALASGFLAPPLMEDQRERDRGEKKRP
jgi:hypothetical protein